MTRGQAAQPVAGQLVVRTDIAGGVSPEWWPA
jgi:hypothetical protein